MRKPRSIPPTPRRRPDVCDRTPVAVSSLAARINCTWTHRVTGVLGETARIWHRRKLACFDVGLRLTCIPRSARRSSLNLRVTHWRNWRYAFWAASGSLFPFAFERFMTDGGNVLAHHGKTFHSAYSNEVAALHAGACKTRLSALFPASCAKCTTATHDGSALWAVAGCLRDRGVAETVGLMAVA